jgi:hypothetical protein
VCTLTDTKYPNKYAGVFAPARSFYLQSYCEQCGVGSGGFIGVHWFVSGNINGYSCIC